jgi:hypothetical protein
MTGIDIYGIVEAGLLEFGGTLTGILPLLGLVAIAIFMTTRPAMLRGAGALTGALWGTPGALAASGLSEAGAALVGAAAAGVLLAEVVQVVFVPVGRLIVWFAQTVSDLLRFVLQRAGALGRSRPDGDASG